MCLCRFFCRVCVCLRRVQHTEHGAGEDPGCGIYEEEKDEPMKLFYADGGYLYAARGYGEQKTSGYSVRVTDCFEGEEGVYIETSLLGPDKGEEIRKSAACPYVVVKMEYIDKQIIFQ